MNKENNKKVLDLMYTSIMSEGGDGDAIWLSKHTPLNEIAELIKEYNAENNIDWEILMQEKSLLWMKGQEGAIITNDKAFFDAEPSWIILRINY